MIGDTGMTGCTGMIGISANLSYHRYLVMQDAPPSISTYTITQTDVLIGADTSHSSGATPINIYLPKTEDTPAGKYYIVSDEGGYGNITINCDATTAWLFYGSRFRSRFG